MKKIILLLGALLAVIATMSVGTFAYFTDTETSSANTITAGDLELNLDGADADVKIIDLNFANGIYPGLTGSAFKALANMGSLAGELEITFGAVTSDDNGITVDAESVGGPDATDGAGNGELDDYLYLAFWLDYEATDGVWSANDRALKSDATVITYVAPSSGTATGGTTGTVVDSGATWTTNAYAGMIVRVTDVGVGTTDETRLIASNTATTLTITGTFSVAVVSGDAYSIGSGVATGGSTLTIVDTLATFGTSSELVGLPVTVTGKGTSVILSHTNTTLTVSTKFSSAVVATDAFSIANGPYYAVATAWSSDNFDQAIVTMEKTGTASDNWNFYIAYSLPTTTGNVVMTDNVLVTITFLLEQPEAD